MPYCEACGAQVNQTAKFCGNCGAQRTPPTTQTPSSPQPAAKEKPRLEYYSPPNMAYVPSAPLPIMTQHQPQYTQTPQIMKPPPVQTQAVSQIIPPIQQQTGEATVGVITLRRMKSLGRYDAFAGVVTTERLIFAQLTADMINQAAQQAREQAKAEGKGFFGAWGDQLKATFGFTKKYQDMPHQLILQETPGNFAIYNSTIGELKLHVKGQHENDGPREYELEIKTSQGTFKYRMDDNNNFVDILKRVYGDRVKKPFGYMGSKINIRV